MKAYVIRIGSSSDGDVKEPNPVQIRWSFVGTIRSFEMKILDAGMLNSNF